MNGSWDDRDFDLGLRSKLAHVVAELTSGIEGAIPEQADYELADELRAIVEHKLTS